MIDPTTATVNFSSARPFDTRQHTGRCYEVMAALTDPKLIKDLPTATEMHHAVADVFCLLFVVQQKVGRLSGRVPTV